MATLLVTSNSSAPAEAVWNVFNDIGNVSTFAPAIVESKRINRKKAIGATRSCDFGGGKGIEEEVYMHEPGKRIAFRGIAFKGVPMKKMEAVFTFEDNDNGSTVTCNMDYAMKGGWIMNTMAKGSFRKNIRGMIDGGIAKAQEPPEN